MNTVRTRFAPSPTGIMHVGGIRTALFAWAYARQQNGAFVLRIEDTDKAREVEGSIEHIIESLEWLGLNYDEGPNKAGEYGPYLQSERLEIYKKYAQQLIDAGLAYADPYTPEQMQTFRDEASLLKQPFLYRRHRPDTLETPDDWYGKATLRYKTPEIKSYHWHDEVRGDLSAGEEALDDFVLIKADGYPTYNFAHVVDDHEMKITHVIRGEEFISSTPKFLSLYDGLQIPVPKLVTAPPILNSNGGKKLSKRDGAKDVLTYRDEGYLPSGVINFLASLGWNDGTEQEIFTPEEIVASIDLSRIQKSGAKFDDDRLVWLNGHHIRAMDTDTLYKTIPAPFWPEAAKDSDDAYKTEVLGLVHERLKFFSELPELVTFFFAEPDYDPAVFNVKKLDSESIVPFLSAAVTALSDIEFDHDSLEKTLRGLVETLDTKTGVLFSLLRVSVTGQTIAPGLFETMTVLGKATTLTRLQAAIDANS